jgi:coproporphyrinogen III oxidase-like Fe-S oxidoreductase
LDQVAPDAEITLEANPTSVEADRFPRLSQGRHQPRVAGRAGDERCDLQALGRTHSVADALRAVDIARDALSSAFPSI